MSSIITDFGVNLLEKEIDDVIFSTNEFLCDATFTGSQGPFWWLRQDGLFCLLKLSDNQLLLNLCPFQKISRGTKTGQNHRKINIRTLLTEEAFAAQSFQRCKDTNLSRKKRRFAHISLIFRPFSLGPFQIP